MKRMLTLALALVTSVLVLGAPRAEAQVVKALDYNVYLGADLTPITAAPDLISAGAAAAAAFNQIRFKTDFGVRAEAVADIIATEDPDVVGLQEVITYFVQDPSDFFGANLPATTVFQDFLALIQNELGDRGDNFNVACQNFNADVELPVVAALGLSFLADVRLVDSDVILVRDGNPITPFSCNAFSYASQLCVPIPGCTTCCSVTPCVGVPECIEFTRGASIVEASVRGATYTLANTHLEVFGGGANCALQAAQAGELATAVATAGGGPLGQATIVTGDFNSEPSDVGCGADTLITAGYVDNWPLSRRKLTDGDTCCHADGLDNPLETHDSRIDYVFTSFTPSDVLATVQGGFPAQKTGSIGGVCTGDGATRCTSDAVCAAGPGGTCVLGNPGGSWPADHCAVVSRIRQ